MSFDAWLAEARQAAEADLNEIQRLAEEEPAVFHDIVHAPGLDDPYTDNMGCVYEVDTSAYD